MGFVVSKAVGNSVVRHRVTRRLREIVRPRLDLLPAGSTVVLRALPGIDDAVFADLSAEVDGALTSAAGKLAARGARTGPSAGRAATSADAASSPADRASSSAGGRSPAVAATVDR